VCGQRGVGHAHTEPASWRHPQAARRAAREDDYRPTASSVRYSPLGWASAWDKWDTPYGVLSQFVPTRLMPVFGTSGTKRDNCPNLSQLLFAVAAHSAAPANCQPPLAATSTPHSSSTFFARYTALRSSLTPYNTPSTSASLNSVRPAACALSASYAFRLA